MVMPSAHESGSGNMFSMVVIKRILDVLGSVGEIKKTNLAGRTGLNYPNCIRYLELLKLLGWVRTSTGSGNQISLTELGIQFRATLSSMELGKQNDDFVIGPLSLPESDGPEKVPKQPEIQRINEKSQHKIMIVDDEPDVLLTYKVFLTKQGYSVEAFPDSKSALESIVSVGPSYYDLVVTDIRMKSLNGLQLYHKIRSTDPDLKVVFVSALDAIEELVSVLPGVTARDIIKKPVSEQEFVSRIKGALDKVSPRQVSSIARK